MRTKMWLRTGLTVIAASVYMAGTASAVIDVRQCGKGITKEGDKLYKFAAKAFASCGDAARQFGFATAADGAKAADKCEKSLNKVYGLTTGSDLTKTALGKFKDKMTALVDPTKGKCDADTLTELGHLVAGGGGQAPGTGIIDFLIPWLYKAKVALAYKENLYDGSDLTNLIANMAGLDTSDCDQMVQFRPNVCFAADNLPQCRTHVCSLGTMGGQIGVSVDGNPMGLDGALGNITTGGSLPIEICKLPTEREDITTGFDNDDFMMIVNQPSRSITPPLILGLAYGCVDIIRAQGYCACGVTTLPSDITFCQDHLGSTGADDCTGAAVSSAPVEDCECTGGASVGSPCLTAGCNSCRETSDNTLRCHSGTVNGAVELSSSGTATAGDCLDLVSLQIKVVGVGAEGTDGLPCTADDLAAPLAAVSLPFTTGTATATIQDRILADGSCSGGSTPGMNCAQNADCLGGTCTNVNGGAGPLDMSQTFGEGSPAASCAALESSDLAGLSLTGAFPSIDAPFLGNSVDVMVRLKLTCQ